MKFAVIALLGLANVSAIQLTRQVASDRRALRLAQVAKDSGHRRPESNPCDGLVDDACTGSLNDSGDRQCHWGKALESQSQGKCYHLNGDTSGHGQNGDSSDSDKKGNSVEELFIEADTKNDGKLSEEELDAMFQKKMDEEKIQGPTKDFILNNRRLIHSVFRKSKTVQLNTAEFEEFFTRFGEEFKRWEANMIANDDDKCGGALGYLNSKDARDGMHKMFKEADEDTSGLVSYEEATNVFKKHADSNDEKDTLPPFLVWAIEHNSKQTNEVTLEKYQELNAHKPSEKEGLDECDFQRYALRLWDTSEKIYEYHGEPEGEVTYDGCVIRDKNDEPIFGYPQSPAAREICNAKANQ